MVRDDGGQVQAGLDEGGHLVPGFEHLAAVDALDGQHLEDDGVPVDVHAAAGNAEQGDLAAVVHDVHHLREGGARPAHLQAHVEALGHAEFLHDGAQVLVGDVHGAGDAHAAREVEAIIVDVGDHDVARANVFGNGGSHHADGSGAGDQDVLANQIEAQGGVHGVPEGIEDRGDVVGNVVREFEGVEGGQHEVLGEGAGAVHADAQGVAAQVAAPGAAVAAVPARDVALAADAVPDLEAAHLAAECGDRAHVLVPDDHGHGDGVLRPGVPLVDVHVGAADAALADPDEQVVRAGRGDRRLGHPDALLGVLFAQGAHGGGGVGRGGGHGRSSTPPRGADATAGLTGGSPGLDGRAGGGSRKCDLRPGPAGCRRLGA